MHFDSVSQFHIHYMLQLNNSDGDAFHRSLIAFYCCLQEEMERLQEELEGLQQECCENVAGCYDDFYFFFKMPFFDVLCFLFCCEHPDRRI